MAEEKASHMTTIGDLLTRDLSRKIEEIIQVDQADEQSVYAEITRRLGELMEADRKAGKLAKGPRGQLKGKTSSGGLRKNPPEGGRSLKKQGIDKNLADRARRAAALPEAKFEAEVERTVRIAVAAVEGNITIIREARAAQPICRCLPRHPRAAALQRPGGQAWQIGRARDARCPLGS
jgi:hypothetical protein